jgi:hypothetical protein
VCYIAWCFEFGTSFVLNKWFKVRGEGEREND